MTSAVEWRRTPYCAWTSLNWGVEGGCSTPWLRIVCIVSFVQCVDIGLSKGADTYAIVGSFTIGNVL